MSKQPADGKCVSRNRQCQPVIPRVLLLFHVSQQRIDPGVPGKLWVLHTSHIYSNPVLTRYVLTCCTVVLFSVTVFAADVLLYLCVSAVLFLL